MKKKKMKKGCSESESDDGLFPEEIVFEILLRLPVKSLCKFRCVSTLWRSVINDPRFVSAHFAHSSAHPKLLISVGEFERAKDGGSDRKKANHFFSIDYPEISKDLRQVVTYHGLIRTTGLYLSHSGGLICIDDGIVGIQVCNPAVGECIAFPKPSIRATRYFLGYDPVDKKHKIVNSLALSGIDILTLGEKEWRRVDPGVAHLRLQDSLCIDGVMHMVGLGVTADHYKAYFVVFDIRRGSVTSIPFPAEIEYDDESMRLIKFGEHAALFDYRTFLDVEGTIELWILEDVHHQVWRCEEFVLPPHLEDVLSRKHSFVGVTHAGEAVFASLESKELSYLYLYRMEDDRLRKIEICGLHDHVPLREDCDLQAVCYYVESLQSVLDLPKLSHV